MQDTSLKQRGEPDSNASAALLMLDIASAKSTLLQLQEACAAASEDHTRTKTALLSLQQQHLEQQGPKYVLDGLKTPLGSRTAAQQLQALHTENLQLKACLKEEVQARQHLERKHGELLELLRSGRVLELLASGFLTSSTPASNHPSSEPQHLWPSSAEVYRRITADTAHGLDQLAASRGAAAPASDASTGMQQQPGRTTSGSSSSSYASSTADGNRQPGSSTAPAAPGGLAGPHHSSSGVSAHSAYFPAQQAQQRKQGRPQQGWQQQEQPPSRTDGPAQHSTHAPAAAATGARPAAAAAASSSPSAGAPASWQDSLQQGMFAKLAQQGSGLQGHGAAHAVSGLHERLQQCSTPPGSTRGQRAAVGAGHAAAPQQQQHLQDLLMRTPEGAQLSTGFEVAGGLLSTTSSSSQSAHSELLDSDDLDELAGLCDTLLQRHAPQPVHLAAGAPADSAAHTPQQQWRQQQQQQELAGTGWFAGSVAPGEDCCSEEQHCQHTPSAVRGDAPSQACAPGLQALAAQLQRLQEQVTATAMDAAPGRSSSSAAFATPPAGPWGAEPSMQPSARHASAAGAAPPQHSSRPEQRRRSTGSTGAGAATSAVPQQQGQQPGPCEGPPLASLQQQLAQRMAEVKQRLSNICNGMLQDGQVPAAPGVPSGNMQSSNSFFSPPASPPAQHRYAAPHTGQPAPRSSAKPGTGMAGSGGSPPAVAGKLDASWSARQHPPARSPAQFKAAAGSTHSSSSHSSSGKQSPAAAGRQAPAAPASPGAWQAGQAGAGLAADPEDVAAAAFASIKASVDSPAGVPGASTRRLRALGLMPEGPSDKPSHARSQHARTAAGAAAAAAAAAGAAKAAAQASVDAQGSSSTPACQQSWASTDDAQASDSEGSWATVDDAAEQQQLHAAAQQQEANEQHDERPTSFPTMNPTAVSSDGSGDDDGPAGSSGSTSTAAGSSRQGGAHDSPHQQHEGVTQTAAGHQQQQRQAGTPSKAAERPVSPISCESSMLLSGAGLTARVPAEVVFSPCQSRRQGSQCLSAARLRVGKGGAPTVVGQPGRDGRLPLSTRCSSRSRSRR